LFAGSVRRRFIRGRRRFAPRRLANGGRIINHTPATARLDGPMAIIYSRRREAAATASSGTHG